MPASTIPTLPSQPTQPGIGAYGTVPQVPSPIGTQAAAITGNVGNLGGLYGLTGSLNTEIAGQAQLPFNLNLPNYQQMIGQSSGNILSQLQGQVPQDVANQIAQMAGERGVATGSIGSPNANTALLRSLGLTSLGLEQGAEGQLTGAIGRTPTGQQFNPQQFLVSPGTMQEAQFGANVFGAAPNPSQAGTIGLGAAQQGLRTSFGGLTGGFGGGLPTDALGFPLNPNMSAGQGYGPVNTLYGQGQPSVPYSPSGQQTFPGPNLDQPDLNYLQSIGAFGPSNQVQYPMGTGTNADMNQPDLNYLQSIGAYGPPGTSDLFGYGGEETPVDYGGFSGYGG